MEEQFLQYRRNYHRTRRVICQSGEKNIRFKQLPEKIKRYFSDLVTTIVSIGLFIIFKEMPLFVFFDFKIHARWRFVISVYLIVLFGSWTLFAMIWYLISYAHNDLAIDHETGKSLHEGEMKCVEGASSFTEFFLLSFELQVRKDILYRYFN